MRALVVGASGQVGGALMQALRARGHEATGTYTHACGARRLAAGHPQHGGRRALRPLRQARLDLLPGGGQPRGLLRGRTRTRPSRSTATPRSSSGAWPSARARRSSTTRATTSSTAVGGPFGEEDEPRPLNVYGQSKLEAERAILGAIPRALVLRTSVVYGPETQQKNFVYQLIRACREGRPFRPAVDQRASPTYGPDLAAASVEACEKGLTGLYHVAGADTLDRWAFSQLVVETFGLDGRHLTPTKTAELTQKAARPLDGGLRVGKAQAALATPLRGAAEGLRAFYLGFTA